MNVLIVSAQFLPDVGGIARSVHRLAESLTAAGHRVLVATKRNDDSRPAGLGEIHRQTVEGVDLAVLPGSWFRSTGCGVGRIPVLEMACDFAPDVVHAYSVFSASVVATVIAKALGVPLVVSCRGQDVTHTIVNFPDRLRRNLLSADHVTYVSGTFARWVEFLTGSSAGTVVHNAIDPSSVPGTDLPKAGIRRQLGLPETGIVFGAFAYFRWKKGAGYLTELLKGLDRRGHDPDAFLLLGDFQPDLEARLAAVLGRDRLVIVERPGRQDLGRLFSAIDLLLLTSYREGMPNVLLEALSAGVAVASTAVDGCMEVLEQTDAGLLLDPFDADCAAGDVAELLDSPERLQSMRREAAELIRREYTVERERDQILEVYSSVLSRRSA